MNSLRRQNSESLQQRGSSRVDSVEDARKPAEDDDDVQASRDGACRPEIGTAGGPEVEAAVATVVEKTSSSASIATQRSDTNSNNHEPAVTAAGSPPASASEGPSLPGGAQQEHESASADVRVDRRRLISVSTVSEPHHPLPDTDVIGNNRTQTRPRPRCRADGGGQGEDGSQGPGVAARAEESDCEESGWLIPPSGEKTQQPTNSRRKSPDSQRRHPYRRAAAKGNGDQFCGIGSTSANARLSPGAGTSSTGRVTAATAAIQSRQPARAWCPAGGALFLPQQQPQQQQWLSRSQPATPPRRLRGNTLAKDNNAEDVRGKGGPAEPGLSPGRGEDGNAAVNTAGDESSKPHWRPAGGGAPARSPWQHGGGSSVRVSSSRPATPPRPRSDGGGVRGSDGPSGEGKPRSTGAVSPGRLGALASPDCRGAGGGRDPRRRSGDGARSAVRGALSDSTGGGPWRSRDQHREPQHSPAPRRESRRRSSNTVASFDSDRYYTAAVRCDRYGYPVHEREGIGSSGAGGGANLFAPMIKGLPDFYESRPNRRSRGDGPAGGGGAGQSLYERTTDWQAKASDLRYVPSLASAAL